MKKIFKLGTAIGIVAILEGVNNLADPTRAYASFVFYLLILFGVLQVVVSLLPTLFPRKVSVSILKATIYFELLYLFISLVQTFVFDLALGLRLVILFVLLVLASILVYALHLVNKHFSK